MHRQLGSDGPGLWSEVTHYLPSWLVVSVGALIVLAWLTTQLKPLSPLGRWLKRILVKLVGRGDSDTSERIERRRTLARFIDQRLLSLAEDTRWDDRRYTELQAEVEIEGRELLLPWWHRSPSRAVTLRRVRSLTRALARSTEPIVVLEGEPGSGKSVALRHLAQELAAQAKRGSGPDTVVPLYLDLKGFRPDGAVTPDAVHAFVLDALTRFGDREITEILDKDFDTGLRTGRWLFLFDSFDEIPAVLAATESDAVVRTYAEAIITFLRVRRCRAVIASREFRGPPSFRLPRFRVVRLTDRQQRTLIRRSGLTPALQQAVLTGIAQPGPALRQMADNPLFLWLLCEYLRQEETFPESAHAVFASYVDHRFASDAHRIEERHRLSASVLRAHAEEIAFCMAARPDLGLEPTRAALRAAVAAEGRLAAGQLDLALDALLLLRLGRDSSNDEPRFTFTHRRLQEYFATCVVLRVPDRAPVADLLADGHWRETVITILQTQTGAVIAPLLAAAQTTLDTMRTTDSQPFEWPVGALHLLEVITIGLSRVPERIPPDIRAAAGEVIGKAWRAGRRHDRLWVLDVVLAAPEEIMMATLTDALASPSVLLREMAYRIAAWLPELPAPMRLGIQRALFTMWANHQLAARAPVVRAQLQRLGRAPDLLAVYRLLRFIRVIDLVLLGGLGVALGTQFQVTLDRQLPLLVLALLVGHLGLLIRRDGLAGAVQQETRPSVLIILARRLVRSSLALRMIGRTLRVVAVAMVLFGVIDDGTASTPQLVLDCIAVAYCFCWAEAAMDQIVLGGSVEPRRWPLLPFDWALRRRQGPGILDERVANRLGSAAFLVLSLLAILLFNTAAIFVLFYGIPWLVDVVGLNGFFGAIGDFFAAIGDAIGQVFGWIGSLFAGWVVLGWIGTALTVIGYAVGFGLLALMGFGLLYVLAQPVLEAGNKVVTNRRVLRAALNRTEPFTALEIIEMLDGLGTGLALREFVRVLRESPHLCSPAAMEVMSDLATAAERGGHRRYRPEYRNRKTGAHRSAVAATVTVPAGSGKVFAAWASGSTRHAADLLLRIDDETVDEITRLVSELRRPLV